MQINHFCRLHLVRKLKQSDYGYNAIEVAKSFYTPEFGELLMDVVAALLNVYLLWDVVFSVRPDNIVLNTSIKT